MNRHPLADRRHPRRSIAAIAVAVLAIGAAACGSDDDAADDTGDAATATEETTAGAGTSAEETGDESGTLEGSVFYLMPNATTPRYVNSDAPAIEAALAEYAPEHDARVAERRG